MKITYNAIQDKKNDELAIKYLKTFMAPLIKDAISEITPCPVCQSTNIIISDACRNPEVSTYEHYLRGKCKDCESTFESKSYFTKILPSDNYKFDNDKNKFVIDNSVETSKKQTTLFLVLALVSAIITVISSFGILHITDPGWNIVLWLLAILNGITFLIFIALTLCVYIDYCNIKWFMKDINAYLKDNASNIPCIIEGKSDRDDKALASMEQLVNYRNVLDELIEETLSQTKNAINKNVG